MSAPAILERIVAATRGRLLADPPDVETLQTEVDARPAPPDALAALSAPGPHVIAEVKRRSPSAGALDDIADPAHLAVAYAAAGAAAVSVLTEPDHFGGSLEDLRRVVRAVTIPCLRKDFIVDRRQVLEARAAGAAMVLLIAAVLDDRELRELREAAEALGLAALVEAHTADETRRAVASGARLVGVNARDLRTFRVDLATCEALRPLVPPGVVAVAESGVRTREDMERLGRAGYGVFLVGTSLVTNRDPGRALRALLEPTEGGR